MKTTCQTSDISQVFQPVEMLRYWQDASGFFKSDFSDIVNLSQLEVTLGYFSDTSKVFHL
jgi:hypothetical protein